MSAGEEIIGKRADVAQDRVDNLEREVRLWSPASSAMWSLWGIISAEEQVRAMCAKPETVVEPEFDYLAYAMERCEMFRREATELGVQF